MDARYPVHRLTQVRFRDTASDDPTAGPWGEEISWACSCGTIFAPTSTFSEEDARFVWGQHTRVPATPCAVDPVRQFSDGRPIEIPAVDLTPHQLFEIWSAAEHVVVAIHQLAALESTEPDYEIEAAWMTLTGGIAAIRESTDGISD